MRKKKLRKKYIYFYAEIFDEKSYNFYTADDDSIVRNLMIL